MSEVYFSTFSIIFLYTCQMTPILKTTLSRVTFTLTISWPHLNDGQLVCLNWVAPKVIWPISYGLVLVRAKIEFLGTDGLWWALIHRDVCLPDVRLWFLQSLSPSIIGEFLRQLFLLDLLVPPCGLLFIFGIWRLDVCQTRTTYWTR